MCSNLRDRGEIELQGKVRDKRKKEKGIRETKSGDVVINLDQNEANFFINAHQNIFISTKNNSINLLILRALQGKQSLTFCFTVFNFNYHKPAWLEFS